MMHPEETATELLRCALSHEKDACLVGNVTARDIATLMAGLVTTCPECGSEAWCNIDCKFCELCDALVRGTA